MRSVMDEFRTKTELTEAVKWFASILPVAMVDDEYKDDFVLDLEDFILHLCGEEQAVCAAKRFLSDECGATVEQYRHIGCRLTDCG